MRVMRAGTPLELRPRLDAESGQTEMSRESGNRLGLGVVTSLVVTDVQSGRPADAAGVRPGDVLTAVNDISVATGEQLWAAVAPLESRAEVRLAVHRGGEVLSVITRLDQSTD